MRVLYLTRSWGGHDERFVQAWRAAGAEVAALAQDGSAPGQAHDVELEDAVRRAIAAEPDVVHAGPLTDVAHVALRVWGGPLIATSWGFDLMDEVDRSAGLRERAREVLARADVVLVDNDAAATKAVSLGASPGRIEQLPWGVDLDLFSPGSPAGTGDARRSRVVLSTRRHETIYRVDVIVKAFVRAATSSPSLRLVVAGSGSLTPELEDLVDDSSVADRVAFVGELDAAGLRDAYRSADLYVSASSVDGTSVSLLEAMACGAPVCVSAIPGNAQWVTDRTGLVFPEGNVDALEMHLTDLGGGDPGLDAERAERAGAALELVRRSADWRRAPQRLLSMATVARERRGEAS